jgi:hypothetical protein
LPRIFNAGVRTSQEVIPAELSAFKFIVTVRANIARRAIFEKEPFGEIECLITQKLLDLVKALAREEWDAKIGFKFRLDRAI